jgi:ankyrin repeat protein
MPNIAGNAPSHAGMVMRTVIKVLLDNNANVTMISASGETLLHIVCKRGNTDIVDYSSSRTQMLP